MTKKHLPISVYRNSLSKIKRRLFWSLKSCARDSAKKLSLLQNAKAGEKAVIVCNGPSLLKTDFSLLQNTYCFGLNKINLIYDKTEWRPSCVVCVNQHVIEQNQEFFDTTETPLFISAKGSTQLKHRENVSFLDTLSGSVGQFARNCTGPVNEGYTVTFVAMQLAFHMGFSQVALVGCDHNFASKGKANAAVTAGKVDHSHFDPKYFADGVTWQLPDLVKSELHYQIAHEAFLEEDRKIFNCTEGGKLELFPRLPLSEFVKEVAK